MKKTNFLTLNSDIQTTLQEYLPRLSPICLNYLLDFLHTYHYDRKQRQFTSSLPIGVLHSFHRELKELLAASEAFPAAFNGQIDVVKSFIKKYPTFKDKPGLWETTLLYSTARNNHLGLVKYLVEEAHCSINAQNQRDVDFALYTKTSSYTPRPTAASTALHGACYNNHLNIAKYLVEHNADYFISNQAHKAPIQNGERQPEIKKDFQDYLVLNYSAAPPGGLPDRPIMDDDRRPIQDCEAIDRIFNDGFDDRYWGTNFGKGKFGHGDYFTDNPSVSHNYTDADPSDQTRIMYYNKVALGKESVIQAANPDLMSAPKGYHSTHGKFSGQPNSDEYIVYRYGQAMPYLKITYKA